LTNEENSVKLPKSFVAVNLSDTFSWEKEHGDEDTDEGGLEMKLAHSRAKVQHVTDGENVAKPETATAVDYCAPRV